MNAIKKIVMGLAVACATAVLPAMADNVSISSADGAITVTVAAGTVAASTPVYLAWDTADKGGTLSAWAHSVQVGTVDAAGDTFEVQGATHSIPNGAAIRVFVRQESISLYESLTKAENAVAYVNTGYKPNTKTKKLALEFMHTRGTGTNNKWPMGANYKNNDVTVEKTGFSHMPTSPGEVYVYWGASASSMISGGSYSTRNTLTMTLGAVATWGNKTANIAMASAYTCDFPCPLLVFGRGNYEASTDVLTPVPFDLGDLTIYSLQIYATNVSTKVADYVPAKKGDAFGLYEKLSGTFYPAEGDDAATGFSVGEKTEEVVPPGAAVSSAAATYEGGEEPPVEPAGGVEVTSAEGQIAVTVPANAVEETAAVYLVWDTTDQDDDFSAWANSAKIGDVTAAGDTFEVEGATLSIPDGAAIRVFVMPGAIGLYESLTKAENAVAYVNTGYKPNTKTKKLALEFRYTNDGETSGNNWPMGANYKNNNTTVEKTGFSRDGSKPADVYTYWGASANSAIKGGPYSTRSTLTLTLGAKATWGSVTANTAMAAAYTCDFPCPLFVFGRCDYEASTGVLTPVPFNRGDLTVYSLQVYATNVSTKVADYVPAKKGGTFGLYEKLSGTFYPAEGDDAATGFSVGEKTEEVVPPKTAISSTAATYSAGEQTAVYATVTGFEGVYDGSYHAASVKVIYPNGGAGCTVRWAYSKGGEYAYENPQACIEIGCYTNFVKITADGLEPFLGSGVVTITGTKSAPARMVRGYEPSSASAAYYENVIKPSIDKEAYDVVLLGGGLVRQWGESAYLASKFGEAGAANILNLGMADDKTENVLWRIVQGGDLDGYTAKCIVLQIGENNLLRGDPAGDIISGVRDILKQIHAKQPNAKMVLLPVLGQTDTDATVVTAINCEIQKYATAPLSTMSWGTKWCRVASATTLGDAYTDALAPFVSAAVAGTTMPAHVGTISALSNVPTNPISRINQTQANEDPDWWLEGGVCDLRDEIAELGDEIDLVFLGDSITHNWGPADRPNANGAEARDILREDYSLLIGGRSGDAVQHLLWRVKYGGILDGYTAKCMMVLIGVNNCGVDSSPTSDSAADTVAQGVWEVLEVIHEKQPSAQVLLMKIFPNAMGYDDTSCSFPSRRRSVDKVNARIKPFADANDWITWVDICPQFLCDPNDPTSAINMAYFNADGLHLSKLGYNEIWLPAIKPIIDDICDTSGEPRKIVATVTGATGAEGEGPYSCTLKVTVPTTGWTAEWFDATTSTYSLDSAPSYNEAGVYTNIVKVTKADYHDFYGTGVVTVVVGGEEPPTPENPGYWLVASDPASASSMNMSKKSSDPAGWAETDGGAKVSHTPTAGNVYYVGQDNQGAAKRLRTPDSIASYFFPGEIVMMGGDLLHKGSPNGTVTVPTLTCKSGFTSSISYGTGFNSSAPGTAIIGTLWTVEDGAVMKTSENSGSNLEHRDLKFLTKIVGGGMLQAMQGGSSATDVSAAIITYDGDLSEFTGRVEASHAVSGKTGGLTVRFTTATALTAGPAELDPDSVVILDGTRLSFGKSVTTHPNRGFKIDGAIIDVDAGKTVTINGPVVAANGFTKTGDGTLIITGDVTGLNQGKVTVSAGQIIYGNPIMASVAGVTTIADGEAHGATLTVTVPATGWTAKWAWHGENAFTHDAPQDFTEVGTYTNRVQVTADGFEPFTGTAVVTLIDAETAFPANTRTRILDTMDRVFSTYDDQHLDDYINDVDTHGVTEHGFPRLTANLGVLLVNGYQAAHSNRFVRMMDICCRDLPGSTAANLGNNFSISELAYCLRTIESRGFVPTAKFSAWKSALAGTINYSNMGFLGKQTSNNWLVFAAASEQSRLDIGMGGSAANVETWASDHLRFFTDGEWNDQGNGAILYDFVTRLEYALLSFRGYNGASATELIGHLEAGADAFLKLQSATGEIPAGGRSQSFVFNEAVSASLAEWYAQHYAAKGDVMRAMRFRGVAVRAVDAMERYLLREIQTHTKSGYQVTSFEGAGYACESYAYFNKYMVTAASYLCRSLEFLESPDLPEVAYEPLEGPVAHSMPADFHQTVLTAGGYTAQFDSNANTHYDAKGLVRIVRRGVPSPLALMFSFPASPDYTIDISNPTALAVLPIYWDGSSWKGYFDAATTYALADSGTTDETAYAVWNVTHTSYPAVTMKATVSANGVDVEVTPKDGVSRIGLRVPVFASDGANDMTIDASSSEVSTTDPDGNSATWRAVSANAAFEAMDQVFANRSGHSEGYNVTASDASTLKINVSLAAGGPLAVRATVADAVGTAGNGPFSCALNVTKPATGWTATWYDENGEEVGETAPSYDEVGDYTNVVKVTAAGYQDFYGTGVVTVVAAAEHDTSLSVDGDTITVSVGAGVVASGTGKLVLCWGAADGGDDPADWEHQEVLNAAVGSAGASETVSSAALGIPAGSFKLRAFVLVLTGAVTELYSTLKKSAATKGLVVTGYCPTHAKTTGIELDASFGSTWNSYASFTVGGTAVANGYLAVFFGVENSSDSTVTCRIRGSWQSTGNQDIYTWSYPDNPGAGVYMIKTAFANPAYDTMGTLKITPTEASWKTSTKTLDATLPARDAYASTEDFTNPIGVFGFVWNKDGTQYTVPMLRRDITLSGFRVYENNAADPVANYVPAKQGDQLGLYDTVGEVFYPTVNAETGASMNSGFTLGTKTGEVGDMTAIDSSAAATYSATPAPRKKQGLIIYGTR